VIVLVSFGVIAWFLIPSLHKLTTSQPLFNPWNHLSGGLHENKFHHINRPDCRGSDRLSRKLARAQSN
jgi:hypothetical protein